MTDKVVLQNLASLENELTAVNTINSNNAAITAAMDNTLSRDGTAPNQMQSELDMNSFQVLNLPQPATANSALRLQDLSTFVGGGIVTNIPAGGTTGQTLAKVNNTDYNVAWTSESAELTAGTNIVLTGSTPTTISTNNNPVFSTSVTTPTLINTGTLTLPTSTDTLVGRATTDTLTHKTFDTAGTGNVLNIAGVGVTANTGTGSIVRATSPTITTPVISSIVNTGTLTLPTSTDTIVGRATTDTLTNKTFDTAGTGNSFSINGLAATANTGTGAVVRASVPTLTTPVIGAATGTSLTLTGGGVSFATSGQGVIGTTTNDNASAGNVGEYIVSNVLSGSAIALITGVLTNLTSISLTAGDWDVWAQTFFIPAATTGIAAISCSISTTSATNNTAPTNFSQLAYTPAGLVTGGTITGPSGVKTRLSLATTTTIFLVVTAVFGVSSCASYGSIQARRRR